MWRSGHRILQSKFSPARVVGCVRFSQNARPLQHKTPWLLSNNARSFSSFLSQQWAASNVREQHGAIEKSQIPPVVPGGAFNSHIQPSDMLSFVNSASFCSYQSKSNPSKALLGSEETLVSHALTHESWMHGMQGHNRRLAFIGRRALKTYLSLFFFDILEHARRTNSSVSDVEYLQNLLSSQQHVDDIASTHHLGDRVGRELGLEKVMRWHSTVRMDPVSGPQEGGLFKVRGSCVEGLIGAIYHYKGAQVAQQFFLSRILLPLTEAHMPKAPPLVRERAALASREASDALAQSP